jgi:DNA-binding transcriptional LysR family regulator
MAFNESRALATFAKAVELGSIRKAALGQGVTPQAASQAIAQLEEHLGVRLLHRTTRSLAATDEGRHLLEQALPALAALEGALTQAKEARQTIAGPIRVSGPKSSFAPVLMPVLEEFCREHPAVQLDVELDDEIGDWVLDRVDVGFRIGVDRPGSGLVARRLFPFQLIVCATPGYLERHGFPTTPAELSAHKCSVFRNPMTKQIEPWLLSWDGVVHQQQLPPAFSTNDFERVRAFIDLAAARLQDTPDFVLSRKELDALAQSWNKRSRRGRPPRQRKNGPRPGQ